VQSNLCSPVIKYSWSGKLYYLDQKVPGIHSENSKYKFYLSKMILSPSKYSPSTATHLCQRLISKHFWNSIVGIVIRAVFDFSITSFQLLKHVSRNGFLIRSNRKKSQGAISGEFDGCWMVFVSFLVKNSWIMMALCDGALSWCKIHELFVHKSKIENTCRGRCTQETQET